MNYLFSKKVEENINLQKALVLKTEKGVEGFLIGDLIGNIHLIDDVIFVQFDNNSLDLVYPHILKTFEQKLLGPIFIGKKHFESEWFLEDLILEF